ncbi:MAG: type II toxin-antitoxin system VapC family toxin [Opitutales bacterium]|jgi:predicted nucleic acid-binding protein|nr:type II toxin-antitoxin system VapC family toxin [Opitutales bacterium]MDP4776945.1 type II toxin-antitoxin system VapC family toxin [Opitutales bacterium]MDP4880065.1 type II toxin-antitoxin system VapC family toxin [Opitutales bacterium]MDP5079918.1 type II toxin-antitoxin system VapC family toxin [Opitutales bacterium]
MEGLVFDTSFLIDFQKERRNGNQGAAHTFLKRNREAVAYMPMTVYGEFAEGFASLTDPRFLSVVGAFELCPITAEVAEIYSRVTRELRAAGRLIGTNDHWIAACALHLERPLVTGNLDHFSRVPQLQLMSY